MNLTVPSPKSLVRQHIGTEGPAFQACDPWEEVEHTRVHTGAQSAPGYVSSPQLKYPWQGRMGVPRRWGTEVGLDCEKTQRWEGHPNKGGQ